MKRSVLFILGLLSSFSVYADDKLKQNLTRALSRLLPEVEITSISATPVDGLYQVLLGPDIIYMTRDGNYVFKGELLDINERRNLTEDVRAETRVALLSGINENEYIEFAPKKIKDAIYVFTDIDCGYCRKLHRDVPELNARGISVRYLAYPRAGVDSAVGMEMGYVWCAEDRQKAMTAAKNRETVDAKSCDSPIARQYELGKQLGVRGTPAIYLTNGRMLPGYMPPNEIENQINR